MLTSLCLAFLLAADPVQPPAHTVPSQRAEQPATTVPSVTIDATIAAPAGKPFDVSFTYTGDSVKWRFVGDPLDVKRLHEPTPNKVSFSIFAEKPARAFLVVTSASKDGVMSESMPAALNVGPPPPPPEPLPPPDLLPGVLATLYEADASTTKQADALALASVYRGAARSTVDSAKLTTNAALAKVLAEAAADLVPLPKLKTIREAIQAEVILKQFPNATAELTPALRDKWRVQLQRIAAALESIAK